MLLAQHRIPTIRIFRIERTARYIDPTALCLLGALGEHARPCQTTDVLKISQNRKNDSVSLLKSLLHSRYQAAMPFAMDEMKGDVIGRLWQFCATIWRALNANRGQMARLEGSLIAA